MSLNLQLVIKPPDDPKGKGKFTLNEAGMEVGPRQEPHKPCILPFTNL